MDAFAPRFPLVSTNSIVVLARGLARIFPPTEISPRLPPPPPPSLRTNHPSISPSNSPLINCEFNFQPMILSKKNGYRIKRPRLHNLPIYHPGRVLTGRRKRKGGVKTLLATRMGARNPHERAHSLSPLLNRNGANRQYDSGPDGVAVRGGESRWKVLERGSGASFLSRRTIYHPERSIGILNTTR